MSVTSNHLPELALIPSWRECNAVLSEWVRNYPRDDRSITILEAGCGQKWGIDLADVPYTLTGIDIDSAALAFRQHDIGDLDTAILGDLRTVELEDNAYDIIYCSYVLEHVDGAADVLRNFARWARPGGLVLIKIPDRDSAFGFITRITPFWLHVAYKRYVQGYRDAGKPGHVPFPTYYDPVISRRGMHAFCQQHGLAIRAEYGMGGFLPSLARAYRLPVRLVLWILQVLSRGKLATKHNDLIFVIEKIPERAPHSITEDT